jgi:hypothetical protein
MGGVDFGGSQSHSMYLRFGGGYVGPGTKVEAYDSQRDIVESVTADDIMTIPRVDRILSL